jgi:phage/conjugal plasmid C-4 type zinc finger TraR family protein
MAGGWTRDGAVEQQIEDTVKDAVLRARALTPHGESAEECDDCGEPIPKKRREALPGVRTCVACQTTRDKAVTHSTINRRGSKDSQLRYARLGPHHGSTAQNTENTPAASLSPASPASPRWIDQTARRPAFTQADSRLHRLIRPTRRQARDRARVRSQGQRQNCSEGPAQGHGR